MITSLTKKQQKEVAVLTDTFQFIKFPKKDLRDTGFATKPYKRSNGLKKSKLARKGHQMIKFNKSLTYPQLVKKLDAVVSKIILARDNYTCVRCGKIHTPNKNGKYLNLTCSHYWDRQYKGTRWDEDNLDALCWRPCHSQKWEHDKQGAYKDFKMKQLGEKRMELLEIKARSIAKFSSLDLQILIKEYSKEVK